jgi:hypothetical protein
LLNGVKINALNFPEKRRFAIEKKNTAEDLCGDVAPQLSELRRLRLQAVQRFV